MNGLYPTPEMALNALKQQFNDIQRIADFLEVDAALLYAYYNKYGRRLSPTVIRALKRGGFISPSPRIRSQITWETRKQKEVFTWYIKSLGYRGISDYCRDIANSNMEAYKSASRIHNRNK